MSRFNDLREAEWIYPAANDRTQWHEITSAHYWEFLEMLPPIYAPNGFMMSEAAAHDSRGVPIRAYFVEIGPRYFVREIPADAPAIWLAELRADLAESPAEIGGSL